MCMERNENYFLGLDIGTDSVGWAVTDMNYNILRRKGNSMWGIRLFDAVNTAAERRMHRTNRRRLQRKRQRIQLLQELFQEEINKVDSKFFQRLSDSSFWMEDKQEKQIYSLFNDENFTDKDYSKEFPTIYHLRAALLMNKKEYDIRLVYLALHHIMKHRGHFLFNGSIDGVTSFKNTYEIFVNCLCDEFNIELECSSEKEFEAILKNKQLSRTKKCTLLEELCGVKKENKQIKEILKLISGMKASLDIIFDDEMLKEIEHNKISFSDNSYEETRIVLEDEIQERIGIIDILQAVYNWVVLADILEGGEYEGKSYLSIAKIRTYEKHKQDLQELKNIVKEKYPSEYRTLFAQEGVDNYCAYVGMYRKNGKKRSIKHCSQEDFYKHLKKLFSKAIDETGCVESILKEIENQTFLPLQVSKDNGVIPYQINKLELEEILGNVKKYLPFLQIVDKSCEKTVCEKIVDIFEFRVPYYVGPLNTSKGENCWMIRKEEGVIRPWNFDQKVDRDQSAAQFINRMTNQCTYLQNETVLPKYSLLYSEYMVLNELNNVKIRNEKLSVELKKEIYNNLFKKYKQITGKRLLDYLNSKGYDLRTEDLSGFDYNFKASLTSYLALKKIFGTDIDNYSVQQISENIILWITLYGDDQKMLKRVIKNNYSKILSEEQIKALSKLRFQGWGRLSRRFLSEIEGEDSLTGEHMTIIQGLRNTQNNLMQLLSQQYSFLEVVNEENSGFQIEGEITYDNLVKDVVASPSVKRAVWQTVQIVEEIKAIMGKAPTRIFVEMARSEEEKKRTVSRKDKLLSVYNTIKDESKDWEKELSNRPESDFKSIKLYLYYTQMGRCMYTGQPIDLSQLSDATVWDRDHIYPQSKTKDDSLDNLVLVDRRVNAKKSDGMISAEIQQKMYSTWKMLRDKNLISEKKYERLTRKTPLSEEELAGFINRQLVETRQSSKIVATLLNRVYENSEIVYVKANAVSDFRKEQLKNVKVRDLNDYHHAKDAYLNIVVGNVYHSKFTNNPLNWLKKHTNEKYSLNRMFDYDLVDKDVVVWKRGNDGTKRTINKIMQKNDILYTRYAYCNKGGLFNQTLYSPTENKNGKLIPIKKGMDPQKYGGYNSVTPSHFMLVESKDKKGNLIRTIETVPLYLCKEFEKDENLIIQYCKENYELIEPRIILKCIKKNARLIVNGFPMHLKGSTGKQLILQGAVQLCIDLEATKYLKRITKYLEENAIRKDKKMLLQLNDYSGISKEENEKMYNMFIDKLENTIYKNRPANPCKKLIEKHDEFLKLTNEEQCIVLGEILHLFQCRPIVANLSLLGEPKNKGKIQIAKNISKCSQVLLSSQSISGIFHHEIDLLKI